MKEQMPFRTLNLILPEQFTLSSHQDSYNPSIVLWISTIISDEELLRSTRFLRGTFSKLLMFITS